MAKRQLTKSKFTQAYECPRKVYYLNHPDVYPNNNDEDSFLQMLAQGGFQVGALAQQYYQPGHVIEGLDKDQALTNTINLLGQENVTLFEAAFQYENLFVRADIVRKKGKFIDLIEVKAKSFNSAESEDGRPQIWNKPALKKNQYKLAGKFADYVVDLAFQTWVLQHALPQYTIRSYLLLADTSKEATVDGLNQRFKISEDERGRCHVTVPQPLTKEQLGDLVLTQVELTDDVKHVINDVEFEFGPTFRDLVFKLQHQTVEDLPGKANHSGGCKGCQFRVDAVAPKKSGFNQCWEERGLTAKDVEARRPFVFDIWNFRSAAKVIEGGVYFADQLTEDDIPIKGRDDGKSGMSQSERQLLQIEFAAGRRKDKYMIDAAGLKAEMDALEYPLHFIDFETAMSAIPFHRGRSPYEQIAFQFSHHVLHKDGQIEEREPFLSTTPGEFPNFAFVRALKKALEGDNGAVLRFAAHENTVLNQIREQLLMSQEPDIEELVEWIQTLTTPPSELKGDWTPVRDFVDMCEWTKRYFYLPSTGGSNSIKKVLPAVLGVCDVEKFRARFGEWIRVENGQIVDPYSLLSPLVPLPEKIFDSDELAEGGAAMMAWCRMQFTEMSELERESLSSALLRYCGLDTLAMVMVLEWWTLHGGKR